jgi:ABC-type oligopeptide transport system substrate-binding subunit
MKLLKYAVVILLMIGLGSAAYYFSTNKKAHLDYHKPIPDRITTLDPQATRARIDYMVARTIYGQMLRINEFGEIAPDIFESWKVNETATEFVFKIHPNAKFHSGRSVKADDIIFSLHYLASADSLMSLAFENIKGFSDFTGKKTPSLSGVRKISDSEVEILLSAPSFIFLYTLADPKIVVLPNNLEGLQKTEFFRKPIGAGPYKLKEIIEDKGQITLERVETYHRPLAGADHFILIPMVKEAAIKSFVDSETDDLEMYTLSKDDMSGLEKRNRKFQKFTVSGYSTHFLFLNSKRPMFQDSRVRDALLEAVDIEAIKFECGAPIEEATGIIPKGTMGWESAPIEKNTNKIGKLNAKSIEIVTYGNERSSCILDKLANQIQKQLGIKVTVRHMTLEKVLPLVLTGNYDILFEHLAVRGVEPFHLLSYFDPQSPHNLTTFKDPKISEYTTRIRSSPLPVMRAMLYRQVSNYISREKKYVIPLFSDILTYVFGENVKSDTVPAVIMLNLGFEKVSL